MKIAGRHHVRKFIHQHPDAKGPLEALVALIRNAKLEKNTDFRQISGSASFVGKRRIILNIKGPKYRLDATVNYIKQVFKINRIGTHAQYDKWRF